MPAGREAADEGALLVEALSVNAPLMVHVGEADGFWEHVTFHAPGIMHVRLWW